MAVSKMPAKTCTYKYTTRKRKKKKEKGKRTTIGRVLAEHAPSAVFSIWQCVPVIPVFRRHRQ